MFYNLATIVTAWNVHTHTEYKWAHTHALLLKIYYS